MMSEGARLAGRYELAGFVAQDGEAEVWEAHDAALDRRVLVKILRPALVTDSAAVERFTTAARAAAREAGPPGQRVLDAGRDEELAMPFVVLEQPQPLAPGPASAPRGTFGEQRTAAIPLVRSSHHPRLVLPLLLVPVVAGVIVLRGIVALPSLSIPISSPAVVLPTAAAAQPTRVATQPAVTVTPRAAAVQPTATPVLTRKRVVNTDGIGVALRASPNGDRLPGKGYDEGVTVTVLEQQGAWTHIRGDDGREGWVLTVTLG